MKFRLTAIALVIAFLGAFVAAPLATTAAPTRGTGTATLTGTGTTVDGATVPITGTVTDLVASVSETGAVLISGVFTDAATGTVDTFAAEIVGAAANAGCQILTLNLGPLFLDLLGLQVDLSQIDLVITAVPGPGNLLGNLLCAVAGLLDGGNASGNAIANLLNRLLGLLG